MISLKSYLLGNSDGELESSYRRMINLFLQAISRNAVEGDKADHERFRSDMNTFAERFTPKLSIAEQFMVLGEALRALEDYNRETSKSLRVQIGELRNMITALTQTVIVVGADHRTSVARLLEIEKRLQGQGMVDDIHLVSQQLGECLLQFRGETLRRRAAGRAGQDSLPEELVESHGPMNGGSKASSPDQGARLPGKAQALIGLQEAAAASDPKFLLLATIDSLKAVNLRYGSALGDELMAVAAEHFRESLLAGDKIYCWQWVTLMAILGRTTGIDSVRAEVRSFSNKKLEKNFLIGSRSVLLPICLSWVLFPIVPPLEVLVRKIEAFTVAQATREVVNR